MFRVLKRLSACEEARADHSGGERTRKTCKEVSWTGEGILDRSVYWWHLFSIDCDWNLYHKNIIFKHCIQTWRCLRSINLYEMRLRSLKFAVEFSLCRISKPYGCVSEIHKNDWLKKSVHRNNNKGTFSHSSHPSKLRGKCLHLEEFVELTAFGGTEQQQFPPKKSYISWSTKSPLLPKNNLLNLEGRCRTVSKEKTV